MEHYWKPFVCSSAAIAGNADTEHIAAIDCNMRSTARNSSRYSNYSRHSGEALLGPKQKRWMKLTEQEKPREEPQMLVIFHRLFYRPFLLYFFLLFFLRFQTKQTYLKHKNRLKDRITSIFSA